MTMTFRVLYRRALVALLDAVNAPTTANIAFATALAYAVFDASTSEDEAEDAVLLATTLVFRCDLVGGVPDEPNGEAIYAGRVALYRSNIRALAGETLRGERTAFLAEAYLAFATADSRTRI